VANTPLAVIEWDADYRVHRVNRRAEEIFGWSAQELTGRRFDEIAWVPEEDWPRLRAAMQEVSTATLPSNAFRGRNRRKDGAVIHCDWYNSWLYDRAGHLSSALSLVQDVTDREEALVALARAQESLRRSELLHRTIARQFPRGVVGLFGTDLRLILHDGTRPALVEDPSTLVGRRPSEFAPPEDAERLEDAFREALAGRPGHAELRVAERIFDFHTYPVRDAGGAVTMGMVMTEDTTDARMLQAQAQVASRLAALGTLVAGVAHEVNNPLGAALAAQGFAADEVARIRDQVRSGEALDREAMGRRLDEVLEALADAQTGSERVSRVVRDFTSFGKADPRRTVVRLPSVVEASMRWLPATVAGSATVRLEMQQAPAVRASPGQLQQVVVNLVTNAAKSIPHGRAGEIAIRVGSAGPRIACLEVADNGVGMSEEVMARIFDPFFTTRPVGEGMGLGLAIAHAIVTAHEGTLTVRSSPGLGTTFRVELPAAGDEAPA
jgi:PAS domain S-box-containing protein